MESIGLLAVVGLLFVKEAGVPVPFPGDLVVLGTGIAAARGHVAPIPAAVAIVVAGIAGGLVQFMLVRSVVRGPMLRLLGRLGLSAQRTEALSERLRTGGARTVAVARMTPGLRVAAIVASGLAGVRFASFAPGLVAGNSVFVGGHFALGYFAGEPALRLAGLVGGGALVAVLVALAALGVAGWLLLRRRRSSGAGSGAGAEADWADAACPVCLALSAVAISPGVGGSTSGTSPAPPATSVDIGR